MNYAVVWTNQALDSLADYWLTINPAARQEMEQRINRLNRSLSHDPMAIGESRSSGLRITFDRPVAILYFVDIDNKSVIVTHFWTYWQRSRPKVSSRHSNPW